MKAASHGPSQCQIQIRPLRIGWCIEADSLDDFTTAVTLSHVFWGGRFNPIIPCADRPMADALISAFNVDALYNIPGTPSVEAFIKTFPNLQWPGTRNSSSRMRTQRSAQPSSTSCTPRSTSLRRTSMVEKNQPSGLHFTSGVLTIHSATSLPLLLEPTPQKASRGRTIHSFSRRPSRLRYECFHRQRPFPMICTVVSRQTVSRRSNSNLCPRIFRHGATPAFIMETLKTSLIS